MIVQTLTNYWTMCQGLRSSDATRQKVARAFFRAHEHNPHAPPVYRRAFRNVPIQVRNPT